MNTLHRIELPGLKGHHPLGFLAACGLLHAYGEGQGPVQAKLAWTNSGRNGDFIAVLSAEAQLDIPALTGVLNQRCEDARKSPAFTWSSKIDDRGKYREAARCLLDQEGNRESIHALATFAALASDLVVDRKGKLRPTMLDLTSGNQRFLESVLSLAHKSKPVSEEAVREALIGPWQYRDDAHSLGWDPQTQRLHALRYKLPENDKANRSVRAAVFLATQALPLFPCFARGRSLYTTGFHRDDNGADWFSWPVWRDPLSLDVLQSLLMHPFTADLRNRGVEVVYRCRRVRTGGAEGNYQVFSHASERPWP